MELTRTSLFSELEEPLANPRVTAHLSHGVRSRINVIARPAFANKIFNPYQASLYGALQDKGASIEEFQTQRLLFATFDVLHLHWPDHNFSGRYWWVAVIKALRLFFTLLLARLKGMRVIWTAHNMRSHAQRYPRLEKVCWWLFYRNLTGIISLNQATKETLEQNQLARLKIPVEVIPHGHYRECYPNDIGQDEARRQLGIGPEVNLVFGWVGQIEPYKGVSELVAAWREWQDRDAALLVAGQARPNLKQLMLDSAAQDQRIRYFPGWLADDMFQVYLNASDLLVLPYRKICNSGSALLGLSFNRPVVLPRCASMEELQESVGKEWVYLYEGQIRPSVLHDARRWYEQEYRDPVAPLDFLDWDRLADKTLTFFRQVCR